MSVAGYIEDEDIEEACQGPCRHVEVELSGLKDHLDLMVDEFRRIRGLTDNSEIHQLCDRAVSNTKQRVPIIEQRDQAQKELDLARTEINSLAKEKEWLNDWNQKPWEIYLSWPTEEEPFGSIPLTITDTGHSDKILVMDCEEVNRLRNGVEGKPIMADIYIIPKEDFIELLNQYPETAYIGSYDTSVLLLDKSEGHIGSIAILHMRGEGKES